MANWLQRVFGGKRKAAEGEYRPGPYLIDGGWLSASAGKLMNWWQAGYSPEAGGTGGAMVEACVGAYAQTVAMCPGSHKRATGDGGSEVITTSDLAHILKRPNDYESMSDFLLNLTDRTYRAGEGYGLAIRQGDRIVEIHRMRNGYPVVGEDGSIFYLLSGNEVVERRFDLSHPIPARDVLHVRLRTPMHPLRGVSPILAVALDLQLSGAALSQQIAFYLNEARPSFMLATDQALNAEQTRDLRARWDEQTKGEKAGGTPILTWGVKPIPVGSAAKDSMLAEMLKLSDQNVALAFRMPLQILGIGGTPFASTESLMSAWKSTGLGFALNHIEEAFGLLFGLKGLPDEYLEFDTDALLRSSFKEMVDALTAGTDKVFTRNEARRRVGLGRKDGGDDLFTQMQDIPIGKKPVEPTPPAVAGDVAADAPAPAGSDVQATALNGAQVAALQTLLLAAATGELPKATVAATIAAAFPLLSADQIAQMVDAIVPAPPAEPPDPQKQLESIGEAMRRAIDPVLLRVDAVEARQIDAEASIGAAAQEQSRVLEKLGTTLGAVVESIEAVEAAIPEQIQLALPPPPEAAEEDPTEAAVAALGRRWETAIEEVA